jgi:hypothetical protein
MRKWAGGVMRHRSEPVGAQPCCFVSKCVSVVLSLVLIQSSVVGAIDCSMIGNTPRSNVGGECGTIVAHTAKVTFLRWTLTDVDGIEQPIDQTRRAKEKKKRC